MARSFATAMTKTQRTLIPTDFTVGSLTAVIDYLTETSDTAIELILVHGKTSSDSITELLGFDKNDDMEQGYREDFLTACQIIKTRFEGRLSDMYSDIITSKSNAYIRNYLKGNKIDKIVLPEEASSISALENSFCIIDLLRKNGPKAAIPVIELSTAPTVIDENKSVDAIHTIFFRKNLRNATY